MFTAALLGKPNVGKSSLFNLLVRRRDALVSDQPGLTRDRRYGVVKHLQRRWLLIDTAGLFAAASELDQALKQQTDYAIEEADVLLLVVSARDGLTAHDEIIMQQLRRANKPIYLVINKIDGCDEQTAPAAFASLGLHQHFLTSATHNMGIAAVATAISQQLPPNDAAAEQGASLPHIALLGRPNSGKSTLFNHLLGQQRAISSPQPGTTRDSITMPCHYNNHSFVLIDTAGLRRRRKVSSAVEKIAAIKSLACALTADVVILLCAGDEGLSSQDSALADRVLSAGKSLVLAINKQDLLNRQLMQQWHHQLQQKFPFHGIDSCYISALYGAGVKRLMSAVMRAYRAGGHRVSAGECNRLLRMAMQHHRPTGTPHELPRLRYIHQGGIRPPLFIVHGSRLHKLPADYRRYLENFFRQQLNLHGTAIAFRFRNKDNPYVAS